MLLTVWRILHSTLGQAVTGVTALATLAWFLWPQAHWEFQPDAFAALVIALITWVAAIAPGSKGTQHDAALLLKFRDLIGPDEKTFLRDHDLGGSFSWHSLEGTQALADDWKGAEFEFDDTRVQKMFGAVVTAARTFIHDLALGSWPIGSGRRSSTVPDAQRGGEILPETWNRIKRYNDQATALYEKIDEFIKFARKRIND